MKFFLDTANIKEIEALLPTGMIDGITTNPSLIAKEGLKIQDVIKEICSMISGPVSAEVISLDHEGMYTEGLDLSKIAKNVVIKVPLTQNGLIACRNLRAQDVDVNVTLCFSATQALLAAKAGATYISPFIGRLDDIGQNGTALIQDILQIYKNYPNLKTQVLAASIRNAEHVLSVAKLGAHVATIPPKLLHQLYHHELTDKGIQIFMDDWKKASAT